jgi:hypothetical protein
MAAKSNLFAIDVDAALRAIEDANKPLVERHKALMEAFDRVPSRLETEADIVRGKKFARQLSEAYGRCRKARLSDTKPIRDLLKRIEAFFKALEREAFDAREEIVASLGAAGRRRISEASVAPSTNPRSASGEAVVVNRETGEVVGTVSPKVAGRDHEDGLISLAWHVDTVDRHTVDLEALRPFITDNALLTAARAHLKAKGSHSLQGATYVQEASLD